MKHLLASRRRLLAVAALAAIAVVVASGYGYAAITATNQVYTGCLSKGTIINVKIGDVPMVACKKDETQISWSQTGPPGADGANGANGANGTNGTNGTDGVSVTSATEPAGANCATGGSKFTAANDQVTYACNGTNGTNGQDGQDGTDGAGLVGSACSLPDNTPGTVQMSVAANGAISFVCQTTGGGTDLCADDLPAFPNATTHCDPQTGTLSITCSSGFANGDNVIQNGCEINLLTDPANCGAVGNVVSLPHATAGCVNGQPAIASCQGENYDVNKVPGDGCERLQQYAGHSQNTAFFGAGFVGQVSCFDASGGSIGSQQLYSDSQVHNPSVEAFNSATGSAPAWYRVEATGGFACINDYQVTFTTSGGSATPCYRLTLQTDQVVDTLNVSGNGTATMSGGSGSYSDDTNIWFKVEKTCSLPVQEAISYTIVFHL